MTVRMARAEGSGLSSPPTVKKLTQLVRRTQPWVLVKIVKYQGLSEDCKVSESKPNFQVPRFIIELRPFRAHLVGLG